MVTVIALAVVAGLGLLFNKKIRSSYRAWQSERLLEEARSFAAAENWAKARDAAIASREARPNLEAFRLAFEGDRKAGGAIDFQQGVFLFRHLQATPQDRADVMQALIDASDSLSAGLLERELGDADRLDRGVRMQLVRLHVRAGRYLDALALAELMSDGEPEPKLDLLVAQEFAEEGEAGLSEAIVRHLMRVLDGEDQEAAIDALGLMATLPNAWLTVELAQKAVDRFGQDSGLEVPDRLRLAVFQIRLGYGKRKDTVNAAISAYQGTHFPDLIDWLTRIQEFEKVIELTDLATARPQLLPTELFARRISALEALGRFEQMSEELEDVAAPMATPILLAYRAVAAAKIGNQPRAMLFWNNAFERADIELTRNYFFALATIAEVAGLEERRYEALARGIEHPFGAPPSIRKMGELFGWLYKEGNTQRLLRLSYRLLRREPDSPMLINNYHFLRSLHEEPAADAVEKIEALIESLPVHFPLRNTLAFIHLRSGRPETTLAVFEASGTAVEDLPNESKAVYSAALRAMGKTEEAEALAEKVDWLKLSIAEVRLLGGRREVAAAESAAEEKKRQKDKELKRQKEQNRNPED